MLVGSDGLGWIAFNDYALARDVGIVALALILFEGGLNAGFDEIRPVLGVAISLAIIGTLLTAVITGLRRRGPVRVLDQGGPAGRQHHRRHRRRGHLRGAARARRCGAGSLSRSRARRGSTTPSRSCSSSPASTGSWTRTTGSATRSCCSCASSAWASASAWLTGWLAVEGFKRVRLATAGLYPVASLAVGAIAYGAAAALEGSGFVAVYLAGLALGSASIPAKQTVANFHQGLGWVAQLAMFLTLGLLVFPSQLGDVAVKATALALVLALVARPLAVWGSTLLARFSVAERLALGWGGLRGAVPVVLATFAVLAHVPGSVEFLNIVFFAVDRLHAAAGHDVRARGAAPQGDRERARAAAAADRGRHGARARRRRHRAHHRRRRRHRRCARARSRPAPRGGGQRARARGRGDPAARLDAPAGRRPTPRPRAPGGDAGHARPDRALGHWPDRAHPAAAPQGARAPGDAQRAAVAGRGHRPRAPGADLRRGGRRPAAHTTRPPRRASCS